MTPDLSTFAKAVANGYPIAALSGKAEYMDRFGPDGGVMFAGTYNRHPVGVSAARAKYDAGDYRVIDFIRNRELGGRRPPSSHYF